MPNRYRHQCPCRRCRDHSLENNNESTFGSDATITMEGPEAEDHPNDIIHSSQAKLTALMRDINDLC